MSDRAVSPVIGVILMVAVTVILAATVSVFILGFTQESNEPGPIVGQSSGDLVAQNEFDGGTVEITHVAGDNLQASNLEIVVDASNACGKSGRLVNLPAEGGDPVPTEDYVSGDDIFDNRYNSVSGPIGEAGGEWQAGETSKFRIAGTPCPLEDGDEITVRVVHTPTNSIPIEQTLTVAED